MHVWERECMGSACTGDHGDAGAQRALMRTCTRSQARVWKVITPCLLRIYTSWIAVSVIVKKYPRQQLNQSVTMSSMLKLFFFLIAGFLGFHLPKFKFSLFHLLSLGGTVRCCSLFSTNVTTSASLPHHGVTSNLFLM